MKEIFLHFLWQHQLFDVTQHQTTDGSIVEIIKIGTYNSNAGPDFLNAQIKIDNTIWIGDIEIHTKSKDWYTHKHNLDSKYNSVILHVCAIYNGDVLNYNNCKIPTLIIQAPHKLESEFEAILKIPTHNICNLPLHKINTFTQNMWFDRLVIERYEEKSNKIITRYYENLNNWEETLYQSLAYNFGFKVNSLAFESLSKSLPYTVILKHRDNLFQLEALLFGQAGLLHNNLNDYGLKLFYEYLFLQKKYSLQSISKELWNFSRLRPANFPTIRIAEFAQLLHQTDNLCSKIISINSIEQCKELLQIRLHSYWDNHYQLEKDSIHRNKLFGESSIYSVLINTVIPFLFSYGDFHSNEDLKETALDLLEKIPAEKNTIISAWENISVQCYSAFRSQALIQLSLEYCTKKKCLQCRFGQLHFTELFTNNS